MTKQSLTSNVAEYVSRKMPSIMEKIQHKIEMASKEGETRVTFRIENAAVKSTIAKFLGQQGFSVKTYTYDITIEWDFPTGEQISQCDRNKKQCCQCSKPFILPHKEGKKFILRNIIYLIICLVFFILCWNYYFIIFY